MKLTDKACAAAKPSDKPYKLTDGAGMYLLVKPNGGKYWRLNYRLKSSKTLALGIYPDVSLAKAREKRHEARKLIAIGDDPSQKKKRERLDAVRSGCRTFDTLFHEWFGPRRDGWSEAHTRDTLRNLRLHISPVIGSLPVSEITPRTVMAVLQPMQDQEKHETAKRVLSVCRRVFSYAVSLDEIDRNPARELSCLLRHPKRRHFACISPAELPELVRQLREAEGRVHPQTINAIWFLMLTLARTRMMRYAEWTDFDLGNGMWRVPADKMKNRRAFEMPLSTHTLSILREQRHYFGNGGLVFKNAVNPRRPMSENTVLGGLKRLGYKGRMTGHGFRALGMTILQERLGYQKEIVKKQLAHVSGDLTDQAYDRTEFLEQRRPMMQAWGDFATHPTAW